VKDTSEGQGAGLDIIRGDGGGYKVDRQ
jgi:hypothetical protein